MATIKQEMLEWVQSLADECTWNDMRYFIYTRDKIADGLKDVEEVRVVSHEEAKRRMRERLK